jgi:hypothetical protein
MAPMDLTTRKFVDIDCSQTEINASQRGGILGNNTSRTITSVHESLTQIVNGRDVDNPLQTTMAMSILSELKCTEGDLKTIHDNATKIPSKFIHNLVWVACCTRGAPVGSFKKWMEFWDQVNEKKFSFVLPQQTTTL